MRTTLQNPPFYPDFLTALLPAGTLLDLRTVGGITYADTILINSERYPGEIPIGLLFHELVHLVQFSLHGVRGFTQRYIEGWLEAGFNYRKIPLEIEAYDLEAEFKSGPIQGGYVEDRLAGNSD